LRLGSSLFLVLFVCVGKLAFCQPDSIYKLSSHKQINSFWDWHFGYLVNKDSNTVVGSLTKAEQRFAEKGLHALQRQAWLLRQHYLSDRYLPGERAGRMLKVADEAGQKGWRLTQAECWHLAGNFCYQENKFTLAFEYMQKAQTVFNTYRNKTENTYLHRYDNMLGNCYYHFGEYGEAVKYLKKGSEFPAGWNPPHFTPALYNNLALCYQQLKQYDSAIAWYKKTYEAAVAFNDSIYMALAQGNMGYTYYLQQQYDKALPLLEADYKGSLQAGEKGSATNAAMTLAAIYIKTESPALAEQYMNASRQYVYNARGVMVMKNWYENLYLLARAKGDHKNAGRYADSLMLYKDSVTAMRDKKAFNQAVLKLESEKHQHEVNRLEQIRKQQVLLRNSLLAVLVLLALVALLWLSRRLLKRNQEKELAQQQLYFAEQELMNYTRQLRKKNDLLQQLRDELNKENALSDREGNINRLLEATILTDEDWKKFRQLFEKVYPGFFIRLKEKMPDLSAADIRLLALTKLQLPPRNMASMLGVSYDAIKKARQRLRKKIDLPEDGTLEELAEMI
jgi:Tetratricopeptide repeat.